MAFIRASQGGGGGGEWTTRDELWKNSNQSSSQSPALLPLNHPISDYEYIEFVFKHSTSVNTQASIFISAEDIQKCTANLSTTFYFVGAAASMSGGTLVRRFKYTSDQSIDMLSASMVGAAVTNDAYAILLYIYGRK